MKGVNECYDYLCKLSQGRKLTRNLHYSQSEKFWKVIGLFPFFYPEALKVRNLKVKQL